MLLASLVRVQYVFFFFPSSAETPSFYLHNWPDVTVWVFCACELGCVLRCLLPFLSFFPLNPRHQLFTMLFSSWALSFVRLPRRYLFCPATATQVAFFRVANHRRSSEGTSWNAGHLIHKISFFSPSDHFDLFFPCTEQKYFSSSERWVSITLRL